MITKKTISKLLESYNIKTEASNIQLITNAVNKGNVNVDEIEKILKNNLFDKFLIRAKDFVSKSTTPSYKDFINLLNYLTIDTDSAKEIYRAFIKKDFTLTDIYAIFTCKSYKNALKKCTTLQNLLKTLNSIIANYNKDFSNSIVLPEEFLDVEPLPKCELSDSDVPVEDQKVNDTSLTNLEDYTINIINNLSVISLKLASNLNNNENEQTELETTYDQTIMAAIYNSKLQNPATIINSRINIFKENLKTLLNNKENAEVYGNLQYYLSILPNCIEKLNKLIEKISTDMEVANLLILENIKKQKISKSTPLQVDKYNKSIRDINGARALLNKISEERETSCLLNKILQELQPKYEQQINLVNKAKEKQVKLKQEVKYYIEEFGKLSDTLNNLNLLKQCLENSYIELQNNLYKTKQQVEDLNENEIKLKIEQLNNEIANLTKIANSATAKHKKHFSRNNAVSDSEQKSSNVLENKTNRLNLAKQELEKLEKLLQQVSTIS